MRMVAAAPEWSGRGADCGHAVSKTMRCGQGPLRKIDRVLQVQLTPK